MKSKKDICVLNNDNTYSFIHNDDLSILSACKKDKSKYIFFPVYSNDGVRYYKEDTKVVLSSIKISITGTLLLCDFTDSGVSFKDPVPISMEAKNIAETYAILGSLYNIEYCCEVLKSSSMQIKPELFEFEIRIWVDGCEYYLNHDMYFNTLNMVEDQDHSLEDDYEISVAPIYDIIGYIENTISYKMGSSLFTDNPHFILFTDNTYMDYDDFKKLKQEPPSNSALLGSTGSSLYVSISYDEYRLIKSDDDIYDFSYVLYDIYENCEEEDAIPDEDVSVSTILELDGDVYRIGRYDEIRIYTDTQFIFLLTAIRDLSTLLILEAEGECQICFSCYINKNLDPYHCASIGESITYNLAQEYNTDLLYILALRSKATQLKTKEQLS